MSTALQSGVCSPVGSCTLAMVPLRRSSANPLKSGWQIINSLLPFCGLWYVMYRSFSWSYWLTLLLAVPTAGFLVRLFIIQHDCGHHSFFRSRRVNDLLGSLACDGSSYYRLPRLLQWFTGNIGFHHIHHLESRIPNYNLPTCYESVPELRRAITFGFWDSLRCAKLKLWDERLGRMVTFADVPA